MGRQRIELRTAIESAPPAFSLDDVGGACDSLVTDFVTTVQDEAIREVMREYTIEGSMGHLFDAAHDNLGLADFTVFEIEQLMGMAPKSGLPLLLYLRVHQCQSQQIVLLSQQWHGGQCVPLAAESLREPCSEQSLQQRRVAVPGCGAHRVSVHSRQSLLLNELGSRSCFLLQQRDRASESEGRNAARQSPLAG